MPGLSLRQLSGSPNLFKVVLAILSVALVLLWMLSINSGSVTSVFHLNGCLPPLDHVAPRREGFAQVYEQELQKEAVGADSKQVQTQPGF